MDSTNQIINAPENCIYLWPSANLAFPKMIAKLYERNDIIFKSVHSFFTSNSIFGYSSRYVIIDHSCSLTLDQIDKIFINNERVKNSSFVSLILDAKEYLVI